MRRKDPWQQQIPAAVSVTPEHPHASHEAVTPRRPPVSSKHRAALRGKSQTKTLWTIFVCRKDPQGEKNNEENNTQDSQKDKSIENPSSIPHNSQGGHAKRAGTSGEEASSMLDISLKLPDLRPLSIEDARNRYPRQKKLHPCMEEHPDELFSVLNWDGPKSIVSSDGEWTRTLRYHIRRQLITAEWGKITCVLPRYYSKERTASKG